MAFPGSRTKTTDVWLLPEDEVLVGRRIRELLPTSGWLCSHPGPKGLHQVHLHARLEEALSCGSVQAFLVLPAGASIPSDIIPTAEAVPVSEQPHAAVVQLLRSRRIQKQHDEVFESGRLAVRWFEPEVGPQMHQLLTDQTRLIWKALRAATRPATVEDAEGRRVTGMRIGARAHDLATSRQLPLTRGSIQRLYLATEPPRH